VERRADRVRQAGLCRDSVRWVAAPAFAKPWLGRDAIVQQWLKIKDDPGSTTFEWHPLIVTDDLAIIEATTKYPKDTYSNLWVLRLDNLGQARQFTEWWMKHPGK